jgi:hypothetical protein
MNKLTKYIIVAAVLVSIFSVAASVYLYYFQDSVIEKRVYYSRVKVSQNYGFDINGSAMIFGEVIPGGSAKRGFLVNNTDDNSVLVRVIPKGDIAKFVSYNETRVCANRSELIGVKAIVPMGMDYGTYEGEIDVMIIRTAK